VVDGPDPGVVGLAEQVADLAVGVVGQDVQEGYRPQAGVGGDDEGTGIPLQVLFEETLGGAGAERAVGEDRLGDDAQAEALRKPVTGHFTAGQCPMGEVPQRPLASLRLVHPRPALSVAGEEGGVGGAGEQPIDRHQVETRRRGGFLHDASLFGVPRKAQSAKCPLEAGQRCPSGSSGRWQWGQIGRPAATTSRATSAIANSCSGATMNRIASSSSSSEVITTATSSDSSAASCTVPTAKSSSPGSPSTRLGFRASTAWRSGWIPAAASSVMTCDPRAATCCFSACSHSSSPAAVTWM